MLPSPPMAGTAFPLKQEHRILIISSRKETFMRIKQKKYNKKAAQKGKMLYLCNHNQCVMDVVFNKSKSLNGLLYVANRLQRADFHKVFKVLYFADRQHLADWGRPITGDVYVAMDAGPVPSRIYDMLKIVRGDSYFPDTEGLGDYFSVVDWMYVTPKKDADLTQLSQTDREALDAAIAQYGCLNYDEIKEKSHDVAWRSTPKDYAISWDLIAHEVGLEASEIDYLSECQALQRSLD